MCSPHWTPPSFDEARAVVEAYRRTQANLDRARVSQLHRAEAKVLELRAKYLAVDPSHVLVKADLESSLEAAIRQQDELKQAAGQSTPGGTILSDADVAELASRASRLEQIWAVATNEERKQILQAVLHKVVISQMTNEWIDLNVIWRGGFVEAVRAVRPRGIDMLIAKLREEGKPDIQIAQILRQDGVQSRAGGLVTRNTVVARAKRLGIAHKQTWRRGVLRIRELVLEGRSPTEILRELQENGPRHYRRGWTASTVHEYLRQLRRGPVHGVPPLPARDQATDSRGVDGDQRPAG